MNLKDHFEPPLSDTRPWEGFHSAWATMIAQGLNGLLPENFVAIPQSSRGPAVEIDVATLELAGGGRAMDGWQPEAPTWSKAVEWPERDLFEIRVYDQRGGTKLAGAVELVSPANKDRPSARQAFAGKCAGYLRTGIGLVVVDVVTVRHQNLHGQLLDLLELEPRTSTTEADQSPLYAVAYRTDANEHSRLDVWPRALAVGSELPTLPLWLNGEFAVPVDLAASYSLACRSLRIV